MFDSVCKAGAQRHRLNRRLVPHLSLRYLSLSHPWRQGLIRTIAGLIAGFIVSLGYLSGNSHLVMAETVVPEEEIAPTAGIVALKASRPPLPFSSPQIGPVIKQGFPDDVDRWTTAFIPHSLDHLTPIEIPEDEEKWIRVDLSEQTVVAYEGERPIRGFIVSTGLPRTPTVTGDFRIRAKVRTQTMTGGSPALGTYYDLPNVHWVQYFYADYGFHGTYWHENFGQPMSHGCINMTNADALWLFDWAGPTWDGKTIWFASTSDNPGTRVIVHE